MIDPTPLPLGRPGKVLCIGLNYRAHAAEAGRDLPSHPMLFAKLPSSLVGPGAAIEVPSISSEIDYEAELGVVIGERAKGVAAANALDVVAGYVCFNDVSARDLQRGDGQWTRGKSLDTFGPIGPKIVGADEVGDPQSLRIECRINGEVVQQGTTADMVFGVAELIAFLSEAITLEPGDVIATGTPAGIGAWHTPPRWLRPGDEVSVEIERIGVLSNPVVRALWPPVRR
jgi:2-keto-4-pentenoate hydratase/2-oxohepta-3-ene-1,7-dioic acid hydratase in catechol pathway